MNALIDVFARKGIFADLLTVFVIVLGVYSTLQLPRETFPNVSFDVVTITTIYPGASPEEVEKLVTNVIEQDLQEIDGVKKLTSISTESTSVIMVQLDPDQTDGDTGKKDIQDVVDQVTDLPEDVETPLVKLAESKKNPIVEVTVASDIDPIELRNAAKTLKKKLERIRGVAKIAEKGVRDREIYVEADLQKLTRFQITLDDIIVALQQQNLSIPGGRIEAPAQSGDKSELIVKTTGEFKNVEDIQSTVIRANDLGQAVRVKDVAHVYETLERANQTNHTWGKPSLNLTVLRMENADAITVVDQVKDLLEQEKPLLEKQGIQVDVINDLSFFIRRRLGVLTNNLAVGLVLVLLFLSAILPFRVALIVSIGIPFAFLGTMTIFQVLGVSINLITVFGLILVVGMLVDDAVVVTDNAVRHIEEGADPLEGSIRGTQEIWAPVLASVSTTIVAFLPLMFMSGIMGKFVGLLPYGVVFGLIISLFECFLILPHHIARWIRLERRDKRSSNPLTRVLANTEEFWYHKVVPSYEKTLRRLLKNRWKTAAVMTFVFFATGAGLVKAMKIVMFPADGIEIFFIRFEAPVGTSLSRTEHLIKPIEKAVHALPKRELDSYTTNIGLQQQDANDPNTKRGSEYGQVVVYLTPAPDRDRNAQQIIDQLRGEIGLPPGLKNVFFNRVNPGPPTGKPIQIGVRGEKYADILPVAREIESIVKKYKGAEDVGLTYLKGKSERHLRLDPAETAAAGLSVATVGRTVRAGFEGWVATSMRTLDEEIDIRVLLPEKDRMLEENIRKLTVRSPTGALIPLSRISRIEEDQGLAAYDHENQLRQVLVTGQVNDKITSSTAINGKFAKEELQKLKEKYPLLTFSLGGENEDTQESMQNLFASFLVAVFGIFMILVLMFGNLHQPLLVLLAIPTGFMPVIWALIIHGMPFSFMAGFGIVALAGVVVNNSIVFMSFVNELRAQGKDRWESIIETGRKRIRPIFLTTVTTVAGLLPTAYGIGGLDPFVVPCALALGWGIMFGAMLTIFVFPCALASMDDMVAWKRGEEITEVPLSGKAPQYKPHEGSPRHSGGPQNLDH